MTTPSRRTFTNAAVLLGVGLFALGGTALIPPLRWVERQLVKGFAGMVDPAERIIDGRGSHEDPWTRRSATPPEATPPPRFLTIDDDPDQWFSSSPLSPVDHALIFARLREAGHAVLGVGHLMAWDEPEPLAMEALRKQLDRFDAAVLAQPLARGAGGEPVPAPLLRMSLAESAVKGDASSFPRVNRLAVPNAELGGSRSLAGFSLLENEADPGDGARHLVARWNDRILFAFPLAVEIAALGLDPAAVTIEAGKEIRLGAGGPVFPIDAFGRTPAAAYPVAIDIPAMRLISEKNPVPAAGGVLVTRDVRSELPAAEKAWSDSLAGIVQALRAATRFERATELRRPDPLLELALVAGLAFFATWASRLERPLWRIVTALAVVGLGAELLHLFAARRDAWLPPLAMLSPGLVALGLALRKEESVEVSAPIPIPDVAPSEPVPSEAVAPTETTPPETAPPEKPARKAAKRAPRKIAAAEPAPEVPAKKAAKKAPAKKTAAKKTARKSARKPAADEADPAD